MKNWKKICKDCGLCCGPVPFNFDFYEQNKEKRVIQPVNEIHGAFPGMVLPLTEFGNCVFLKTNKRCAIYKDRPQVCKLYETIPEMSCPKANKQELMAEPTP